MRGVRRSRVDWLYIGVIAALVSVGLVMITSATVAESGMAKLGKQLIGLPCLLVGLCVPVRAWRRATPWLLAAGVVGLLLLEVLPRPWVRPVNGATRWIFLPGIGQIQPSEFVKLAFVLFAANLLDKRGANLTPRDLGAFLGVLAALAGLIYLEPDLGTALVVAGIALCMLIAAGLDAKRLAAGVLILVVAVGGLAMTSHHQRERILAWWDPWKAEYRQDAGLQVVQSLTTISQGGVAGVGPGRSVNKLHNRLPEAETDFIFAVLAAELGLVGATGVILLFGTLAWRGYQTAARAPTRYTSLVVTGITSWIAVQAGLNLAVVTDTVPNTGVPLPFISSGVSSLAALLIAVGIVIQLQGKAAPP
ncbi:MAG TPA: putative peptidoglycan glycosyltransferase FtsW [Symbiobacteriaceae bacterium]|nr:putative peptidoglycan glycosyltransferase FtsW [Symbiobacteriaceae bacterium]